MRTCLLTSTGIRHAFMAQRLAAMSELALVIREEKGFDRTYADHPDRAIIEDHFARLATTEEDHFVGVAWDHVIASTRTVARGALNTPEIAEAIAASAPDVVIVFGCGIVKPPVLDVLPAGRTWNLHQGLSPYYRGSGTNFWPFVEGRFEYIGVTLHSIDAGIDTGGILAHDRPEIARDDTLHAIGCKTVERTATLVETALRFLEAGDPLEPIVQWSGGKLYRRADLTGAAILQVRAREASGDVAAFVERRAAGRVPFIRLITLAHDVAHRDQLPLRRDAAVAAPRDPRSR